MAEEELEAADTARYRQLVVEPGRAKPALDHRLVHLEVKLERVDVVAVAKRLVGAAGGGRGDDQSPA